MESYGNWCSGQSEERPPQCYIRDVSCSPCALLVVGRACAPDCFLKLLTVKLYRRRHCLARHARTRARDASTSASGVAAPSATRLAAVVECQSALERNGSGAGAAAVAAAGLASAAAPPDVPAAAADAADAGSGDDVIAVLTEMLVS